MYNLLPTTVQFDRSSSRITLIIHCCCLCRRLMSIHCSNKYHVAFAGRGLDLHCVPLLLGRLDLELLGGVLLQLLELDAHQAVPEARLRRVLVDAHWEVHVAAVVAVGDLRDVKHEVGREVTESESMTKWLIQSSKNACMEHSLHKRLLLLALDVQDVVLDGDVDLVLGHSGHLCQHDVLLVGVQDVHVHAPVCAASQAAH